MKPIQLFIYLFLCGQAVFAQAQHALVRGNVTHGDRAISAATLYLHNQRFSKTVATDTTGYFSFTEVPPGEYVLVASCTGFSTAHASFTVTSGGTLRQDFKLEAATRMLEGVTISQHALRKENDIIDINKVAAPTAIITKKTIRLMGSRRLDEVLREQNGMAMVNDLGSGNRSIGIQMQGFSSEYIMILIDGQPMTGRFNGNFDLSRISVSDVERIEVIKGASSSLYGSEAMGGVINIITRQYIHSPQATANLMYGTYNTLDASLSGETPLRKQRGYVYASGNYYRTDGFNVNTQYLKDGQTSPPYNSLHLQGRAKYKLSDRTGILVSSRFADRQSVMSRSYGAQPFNDRLDEQDINTAASLNHYTDNGWRLLGRYYLTHYRTDQAVNIIETGKELQANIFSQWINRAEFQAGRDLLSKKLSLIGGAGGDHQTMNNSSANLDNNMVNYFGYAQANYNPSAKYGLIAGLRYDGNSIYGGKLNLSVGATWEPAAWISFKASLGNGFKAPTYAQMYQVFTNITQGYTVVGANNFHEKTDEMNKAGLIQQIWPNAAGIRELKPETSTSYNLGVTFLFAGTGELSVNGFYNNIRHLINTEQFGIMRTGQQLFSYININKVFTRGVEAGFKYSPVKGLYLTAGYQLLDARSNDIIDAIKNNTGAYSRVRTPEGIRQAAVSDYFGLPNRSRHMGTLQAFYEHLPWGLGASVRASYRGKYGFLDIDNNGYIDRYDVFVDGYTLFNASLQKSLLKKRLTLRFAADNIGNVTNYLMPSQPGRVFMAGFSWHFGHPENN